MITHDKAASDRQQNIRWPARFASGKCLHGMTAHTQLSLLAHGLSVKLNPYPCSHSSPVG